VYSGLLGYFERTEETIPTNGVRRRDAVILGKRKVTGKK
jgi:hypothetical protein